ncbi:MAG TPA: MG2 domain-containing protein, partial [Vicinamibacteria bacterium]|nr:MG2 domain-containing protein [Vicinamibacteria bacterium]
METTIDLAKLLPGGLGQAIVSVEPTTQPKDRWRRMGAFCWVQGTRLGLTAFADGRQMVAWASALADGRPLAGVELTLLPLGLDARSDREGLARFDLSQGRQGSGLLVARQGDDLAILPENLYNWDATWRVDGHPDRAAWYVADDRGLYRPGEEVKVKGWVRRIGGGPAGDVSLLETGNRDLRYVLRDSRGNEVAKGETRANTLGGFDLALKLPPTMNLGPAALALEWVGAGVQEVTHHHTFQVQEFRRPEFEVQAQASEGPHLVGEHAEVTLRAGYYAGGGLPGAEVGWQVAARPTTYTPPNRSDFIFGVWTPWWLHKPLPDEPAKTRSLSGRTDGAGRHVLRIDFDSVEPPRPSSVSAEGTVTDVNRQAWTGTAALLVHPSRLYVGLKTRRAFVQKSEALEVQAIVTDIDGAAVPGREFKVQAERLDWVQEKGEWREKAVGQESCALTSGQEAGTCRFATPEGGVYRITARVADERGRANQSEFRVWVAGGKLPPRRNLEREEAQLIPGQKEYRAGETAEILVLSPFVPAEGVLTLRREGLVRTQRFRMEGASHTLRIPIEDGFTPNVHVQVDLNGAASREEESSSVAKLPKRPAFASGTLDLSVPPVARTLGLAVKPRQPGLEPGGSTVLDVSLTDAAGKPVPGGEVAVVVVDEAVLALTRYALPDPLAIFYPRRLAGVSDFYLRPYVYLARPQELEMPRQVLAAAQSVAFLDEAVAAPAPMPR